MVCIVHTHNNYVKGEYTQYTQAFAICRKFSSQEKNDQKSTYPPPADGLHIIFFCKGTGSANASKQPAYIGAREGIAHFTECNILQRIEKILRGGSWIPPKR